MLSERYFKSLNEVFTEANYIIKEKLEEDLTKKDIKNVKDKGDKINKLFYELMDELGTL